VVARALLQLRALQVRAIFNILSEAMLQVSATAWVLSFAGFVLVYCPLLTRRRI